MICPMANQTFFQSIYLHPCHIRFLQSGTISSLVTVGEFIQVSPQRLEQIHDILAPSAVHGLAPAPGIPEKSLHQLFEPKGRELGVCPSQKGQFPSC